MPHESNGVSASAAVARHWRLRWSSAVTRWTDPFDVCSGNGERSSRLALVVGLELLDDGRLGVEAWLEMPGRRQELLPKLIADGVIRLDGTMCHVDAALPDGGRLAVSFDHLADRLLYAQGSLTGDRFPAGSFDPPTIERVNGRVG
ncbi:MAG: hypothetical protein ACYTJ0_21235 [Planctomycetota bacterium]